MMETLMDGSLYFTCEYCAGTFLRRRSDQRFCSDACRKKYIGEEKKAATRDKKFGYQNKRDDDE